MLKCLVNFNARKNEDFPTCGERPLQSSMGHLWAMVEWTTSPWWTYHVKYLKSIDQIQSIQMDDKWGTRYPNGNQMITSIGIIHRWFRFVASFSSVQEYLNCLNDFPTEHHQGWLVKQLWNFGLAPGLKVDYYRGASQVNLEKESTGSEKTDQVLRKNLTQLRKSTSQYISMAIKNC